MKKTACIYTSNTGVGLVADVDLLQDLLFDYYDVDVVYFEHNINSTSSKDYVPKEYDVGIYIQEFFPESLLCNKKNIFFVNEEWLNSTNIKHIRDFDKVICKSTFSQQLLSPYNNNVVNCGFISRDKYDSNIPRKNMFLHLGGKSWQKGTESVLNIFNKNELPLTFIQSNKNYDNSDKDKNIEASSKKLYQDLSQKGFEVILDDRNDGFGKKIKDNELVGIPLSIVFGKNFSENDEVEIIFRDGKKIISTISKVEEII